MSWHSSVPLGIRNAYHSHQSNESQQSDDGVYNVSKKITLGDTKLMKQIKVRE